MRWAGNPAAAAVLSFNLTPTTAMTHIAIQGQLDGKVVDWMEKVEFADYDESLKSRKR